MTKTAKDAASGAVSKNVSADVNTGVITGDKSQALVVTGDGDISGPMNLALALSQETQDKLTQEFADLLSQVETGFDALVNPTAIATNDNSAGLPFYVIDALTIDDYFDRTKGEILTKHIFRLEFPDGRIMNTMQGNARPRQTLARMFTVARAKGMKIKAGPYLYEKKPIPGQPQAAWIFSQQPGFQVVEQ